MSTHLPERRVRGHTPTSDDIATRQEVLALLSEKARAGSVSAAIALERALRIGKDEPDIDDELDRILGRPG